MTLVRVSPFRGLVNIQDEMNRLFNDFFSQGERSKGMPSIWSPLVDIAETDNDITVTVEAPGMQKDDINITIQDNVLTLKGEKKQENVEKKKQYHRIERTYGQFERSFSLPTTIQTDKVKAGFRNGVLTITLPKSEEAKPKEVTISVN